MNKYRGRVPIELDGQQLIMQFDLDAIALLKANLGEQGHLALNMSTSSCDVKTLLIGVCIGLEKYQPGQWSPEKITAIDPVVPVKLLQEAVFESLMAAWHGEDGPPEEDPPVRPKGWWSRLMTQLFGRWTTESDRV